MSEATQKSELLTITEAAEYLNQSHWTVRKWIRQNRFPYIQINSRVIRIRRDALDEFLKDSTIPQKKI